MNDEQPKGTISQEDFDKLPDEEKAKYGFIPAGTEAEMADRMRRAETPEEAAAAKEAYLAAGYGTEESHAAEALKAATPAFPTSPPRSPASEPVAPPPPVQPPPPATPADSLTAAPPPPGQTEGPPTPEAPQS